MLPDKLGNNSIKRIISFYSLLWQEEYGMLPKSLNWGQLGKQIKQMLEDFTEEQIACLIILHFEWHGANGDDDFTHKKLRDACFPLSWLPKNVDSYRVYYKNGLGHDLDDPDVAHKLVDEVLTRIQQ